MTILVRAIVRRQMASLEGRAVNQQQLALYSARSAHTRVEGERRGQRVNSHLALGGNFDAPRASESLTSAIELLQETHHDRR
jgi:hypothetical protein